MMSMLLLVEQSARFRDSIPQKRFEKLRRYCLHSDIKQRFGCGKFGFNGISIWIKQPLPFDPDSCSLLPTRPTMDIEKSEGMTLFPAEWYFIGNTASSTLTIGQNV
jgi:hypothetical protein